jgi:hypothetical protein
MGLSSEEIVSSNEFKLKYQTPLIRINQTTINVTLVSNQQFQLSWSPLWMSSNYNEGNQENVISIKINEIIEKI